LRANRNVRPLDGFRRSAEVDIWRADDDLVAIMIRDQGKKVAKEVAGLVGRFIHFPVGGD
jgi:hypothetical protein